MSRLTIYPDHSAATALLCTVDATEIATALRPIEVGFERWQASRELGAEITDAAVLEAYHADIERLTQAHGYRSVDVLRCRPDHPNREQMRHKFLDEHTHDDDEVRFFVEGAGVFYLHAAGKVFMMLCERGDLLSVPAGMRHWFDMGASPHFTVIRLFTTPEGWVANFTGESIARQFPEFQREAA
jgi:1,2-dihydroxy-3-keto-5-methylthiopentene dioxygenase